MSGASGKVLAAIHLTPESSRGGLIGRIREGDIVSIDADEGTLTVDADLSARQDSVPDLGLNESGTGRELFAALRRNVTGAEQGASIFEVG
jgi:phosphogluconate dehydratase